MKRIKTKSDPSDLRVMELSLKITVNHSLSELRKLYRLYFDMDDKAKVTKTDISIWLSGQTNNYLTWQGEMQESDKRRKEILQKLDRLSKEEQP